MRCECRNGSSHRQPPTTSPCESSARPLPLPPSAAFSEAVEPRPMPLACLPPASPLIAAFPHPLQNIRNLKRFRASCLMPQNRTLPSVVEPKSCCWFRVRTHPRTEHETRHPVVLLCGLPASWCFAYAALTVLCLQPFAHPLRGESYLVCCVCDMLVCHCPGGETKGIVDSDRSCGGFLDAA